ncbi:Hypothetical predicted protein [Pelobates cultripes]|uniref:Uncharacterized protein n=1 Tax=Pelobates cultripes TaxID=61616 RepID=A0AAD1R4H4_PELCU|nr:Hypothetical predicted protein [Pelobates cultripes]
MWLLLTQQISYSTDRINPYRHKKTVSRHLLTAAKLLIPVLWWQREPPMLQAWIQRVEEIRQVEAEIAVVSGRMEKHEEIWRTWTYYLCTRNEPGHQPTE